jgi:hypothetical protein
VKNLFAIIILLLLSSSVFAQQNRIGLTCTATNENPMMFKVVLDNESAEYFDLARNSWSTFTHVTVRIGEVVLMPLYNGGKSYTLSQQPGFGKIHIDRTTLEWMTRVSKDFDEINGGVVRRGSCSVHTYGEIDSIAKREYDRLNNIRAF